jgi:hypothetical protein
LKSQGGFCNFRICEGGGSKKPFSEGTDAGGIWGGFGSAGTSPIFYHKKHIVTILSVPPPFLITPVELVGVSPTSDTGKYFAISIHLQRQKFKN